MATTSTGDIKLSEAQRTRLLKQCRAHYDRTKQHRGDWPSRHAERYRRHLADHTSRPRGPWPGSARLFIPAQRDILERQLADMTETLFGTPDNVKMVPFGDEDAGGATLASRFLRWALSVPIPFLNPRDGQPSTANEVMFDALLDGAGVMKIYPKRPDWTVTDPTSKRHLSQWVQIDALDQGRFLVPSGAEGLQFPHAEWLGHELFQTMNDLRRLKARGYDVPTTADQFPKSTRTVSERKEEETQRDGESIDYGTDEWCLMVEMYERFRLTDKGYDEDVIVSWLPDADERYQLARVIRLHTGFPIEGRPLRPFFPVTIWPQPRQWRGLNVADRLRSLQDVTNKLHEQMIDYGSVSILPFFFYNAYLTGDVPNLREVMPGTGVPLFDLSGLQMVFPKSMNRHFVELLQLFGGHMERAGGVSDFNMGRQPDRPNAPRTLGATALLLQQNKQAHAPIIRHLAGQHGDAFSFFFALWQARFPASVYATVGDPKPPTPEPTTNAFGLPRAMHGNGHGPGRQPTPLDTMLPDLEQLLGHEQTQGLLDRLFGGNAQRPEERLLARKLTKADLSGLYDAVVEVDPNAQFDKQVLLSLVSEMVKDPQLQYYPLGRWAAYKRVWQASGQTGFEEIWPRSVAEVETLANTIKANLAVQQLMLVAQGGVPQPQGPVAAPEAPPMAPPEMNGGGIPMNGAPPAQVEIPGQELVGDMAPVDTGVGVPIG